MIIPEGVNRIEFYKAAKAKGVKIKSKYKGVYVAFRGWKNRDVCWRAHLNSGKLGKQFQETFPFTPEGELAASKKYIQFVAELQKQLNPPI